MDMLSQSPSLQRKMLLEKWRSFMMLLFFTFSPASGAFVGVNIGTDMSNLPKASDIVSILQAKQIEHVRLFDADHQMLNALANTGIEVMVGVPNDQLMRVGNSRKAAMDWVNRNIAAFVPLTNITYIAVGDEVLTTMPDAAYALVPAMQFLHSALVSANLNFQVKISSPQSMQMISEPFPPSSATFNSSWNGIMNQFLEFLKNTEASFMLNVHPYHGYTKGEGIFSIEFALFQSSKQIADPDTLHHYSNMFDAMVDAAYYSMQALNFSGVAIMVTEAGWPSVGGTNERDATLDNALVYNSNLIRNVLQDSGTPSQPSLAVKTYIHELFNEDLLPGPISEKNWGIAFPNGTSMYSLEFLSTADVNMGSPVPNAMFCVAIPSADQQALKEGLDWACGPGMADCSAILPGKPCYDAGNIVPVASYAYNDYYHRALGNGGTCSFSNTAMITNVDPSHGTCIFAGSSSMGMNSSTTGTIPLPGTGASPPGGNLGSPVPFDGVSALHATEIIFMIPLILLLWV